MTEFLPTMRAKIQSLTGVLPNWNQTPSSDLSELATEGNASLQIRRPEFRIETFLYDRALQVAIKSTNSELIHYEVVEAPETTFSRYESIEKARYVAENLIRKIGRLPGLSYRAQLVERLLSLVAISDEEEPDGPGIATDSLETFLRFLQMTPKFKYPSITLTPSGNIYATWKKNSDELLSIHFLPEGVNLVVFQPDKHDIGKPSRLWSTTSLSSLVDYIPRSVLAWATA